MLGSLQFQFPSVSILYSEEGAFNFAGSMIHLSCWTVALVITTICNPAVKAHLDNNSNNASATPGSPPHHDLVISDISVAIGIASTTCSWLGVLLILYTATFWDVGGNYAWEWSHGLPVIFFFTVFGTISSLYIFCIGAQDPSHWFFWLSLVGTSVMLFAQLLLFSSCQQLNLTHQVGTFCISCVVSIQLITAMAISGGDFEQRIGIHGITGISGTTSVGVFTGEQEAVAWISPMLTLLAFGVLYAGRQVKPPRSGIGRSRKGPLPSVKTAGFAGVATELPRDRGAQPTITQAPQAPQSPLTIALILFFFTLAALGNVYVLSFVSVGGTPTAISFCLFGAVMNIAVLFNAIGSNTQTLQVVEATLQKRLSESPGSP